MTANNIFWSKKCAKRCSLFQLEPANRFLLLKSVRRINVLTFAKIQMLNISKDLIIYMYDKLQFIRQLDAILINFHITILIDYVEK